MNLIHILKHGYSYSVTDGDDTRQVLVPPNKHMIAAANAIEKILQENEKLAQNNQQLYNSLLGSHDNIEVYQQTITKLHKELDDAKAHIQHLERKPADGDASADFQRSTDKG